MDNVVNSFQIIIFADGSQLKGEKGDGNTSCE